LCDAKAQSFARFVQIAVLIIQFCHPCEGQNDRFDGNNRVFSAEKDFEYKNASQRQD
jgi:hypothetical protein